MRHRDTLPDDGGATSAERHQFWRPSHRHMRCPHQAHGHYDIGGSAIPVALYRSIPRLGSRETFALSIPRYRSGINRLRWMDRPTGRVIRRIDTSRCGELVHIDVKKLARIPDGGGHSKLGRRCDGNQPGGATPTSTPRSTPTRGSPIESSRASRTPRTVSRSSTGRSPGSPTKASPSNGS